jgi:hypothetical protein
MLVSYTRFLGVCSFVMVVGMWSTEAFKQLPNSNRNTSCKSLCFSSVKGVDRDAVLIDYQADIFGCGSF